MRERTSPALRPSRSRTCPSTALVNVMAFPTGRQLCSECAVMRNLPRMNIPLTAAFSFNAPSPANNAPPGLTAPPTTTLPGMTPCTRLVKSSISMKSGRHSANTPTDSPCPPPIPSPLVDVDDAPTSEEESSPEAMRRAHCSGDTCLGSDASSAVNGMTSTFGMDAATMATDGPSMVCPRPPMQPVTTPPKMAGGGAAPSPAPRVKHSATNAAAGVGSG